MHCFTSVIIMKKLYIKIFFVCIAAVHVLWAQPQPMADFLKSEALSHAGVGISVLDTDGQQVWTHNDRLNLIPASTTKALLGMMAYHFLGDSFRYATGIYIDGEIDASGTLIGDLIIYSEGDPSFCSSELNTSLDDYCQSVYEAMLTKGISCIEHISYYGKTDQYQAIMDSWAWQDVANYYGGGAHSFNILDNTIGLYFNTKGQIDQKAKLFKMSPKPIFKLTNKVTIAPAGTGDRSYVYYRTDGDREIRGQLPSGHSSFKVKAAMSDPLGYFIRYLSAYLMERGIQMPSKQTDPPRTTFNQGARLLYLYQSPPLSILLKRCLEKSINLYAEGLMRSLLDHLDVENPQKVLELMLDDWGIADQGAFIYDGSGLSPRNAICAGLMSKLLDHARSQPWYDQFLTALARGGKEGTLKGMFKKLPDGVVIYAKSGGMSKVVAYVGYVYLEDECQYSFSIIVNNFNMTSGLMRKRIDDFIASLIQKDKE